MNQSKFVYNNAEQIWYGPDHDPSDNLDYGINFSGVLNGDAIDVVSSSATGVSITNTSVTGNIVYVWITGGSVGTTATVTINVTTVGGRLIQRSFKVRVRTL